MLCLGSFSTAPLVSYCLFLLCFFVLCFSYSCCVLPRPSQHQPIQQVAELTMGLFSHLDATPTDLSTAVLLVAAAQGLKRRMHMARVLQHIRKHPTPYGSTNINDSMRFVHIITHASQTDTTMQCCVQQLHMASRHRARRAWRRRGRAQQAPAPRQGPYRPPSPVSPSRTLHPQGAASDSHSSSSSDSSESSDEDTPQQQQQHDRSEARAAAAELAPPLATETVPAAASPFAALAPSQQPGEAATASTEEEVAREVLASLQHTPSAIGQVGEW